MSRVIVYNRQGVPIGEVDSPNVVRSWVLNEPGVAAFILPITDGLFDKDKMAFGNLIRVTRDRVPDWVGVLWPYPQPWQWSTSGVSVRAISAEGILRRRVSSVLLAGASMGVALETVLGDLNEVEDTLLRPGTIWKGGPQHKADFRFMYVSDRLTAWTKAGRMDWGVEPLVDEVSGRLTLSVSMFEKRGEAWDFALEDGKNFEWMPDSPLMTEQGELYNEVIAFQNAVHNDVRDFAVASDSISRSAFGLAQTPVTAQPSLQAVADGRLTVRKQPRRTFRLNAVDVDNTFDYLGLGDSVWLKAPSIHWQGILTRVRVLAREFSDATGKMVMTLDEVVS